MAEQTTVEIPITSEGVLGLRNSVQVLKEAYKRGVSKQIVEDESALLPMTLEQLKGIKGDLVAAKGTVDNYYKMTADDQREPTNSNINSYKDLNNVQGNYPVTDEINQEIKSEINSIFKGNGQYSMGSSVTTTSKFEDKSKDAFSQFGDNTRQGIQRANKEFGIEGRNLLENEAPPGPQFDNPNEYFKSYEGMSAGDIIKECIPCDFRKFGLDQIQPMTDLLSVLEQELVAKYRAILGQFSQLLNNNEINEDICSLLNFLNFQCVPDLFGILSLLKMMILKLTDIKLINPTGLFMGILTPFFAPILNGVTELLDKYIQLILGPIDCVIDSLDAQLAKLDVGRALDAGDRAELNQVLNRRRQLEAKRNGLIERRNYLLETNDQGQYANEPSAYQITDLRGRPSQQRLELGSYSPSRQEELARIEEELSLIGDRNGGEIAALNRRVEELRADQPRPSLISAVGEQRQNLRGFRNTLGKSLQELRVQVIRGKNMINDTADNMRKELTRLITGRAATSEEMLQGAMELQRLARMVGIVQTMIRLVNGGKLCDNGNDPNVALGNFLTARSNSGTANGGNPAFYRGTDDNGSPVLLVTTSDAELSLVDDNNDESKPLENLDEVSRLNAQGVAPDIGSIAQKRVSATSQPLGVEVPVAVVPFNLCGETSASTSETVDNIKQWASNLG
jgi:hypothetical protein